MPIIDFRYRPGTRECMDSVATHPVYAEYIKVTDFLTRPVKTLDACIAELRQLGIVTAVITGRDCESTYNAPSGNAAMLEYVREAPDLFLGFYGFDPGKGMPGLRAFRTAVEKNGVRGASIDPGMAHRHPADARYYPLYAACCEYNIPVIVTAGLSPFMPDVVLEHMNPLHVDTVAADFPELRILISHGGYPWVNEAIAVVMRNRNVYLDFSTCENKPFGELYIAAANTAIADKVVFSSASPFVEVGKAVKKYQELPFTTDVREKMFYHNGLKFLGFVDSK